MLHVGVCRRLNKTALAECRVLTPCGLQARCVEMASRLSALLHERLSAIETLQGGPQGAGQMAGAAAAEQALLVRPCKRAVYKAICKASRAP